MLAIDEDGEVDIEQVSKINPFYPTSISKMIKNSKLTVEKRLQAFLKKQFEISLQRRFLENEVDFCDHNN